jgi:ATP/ADP translocase
MRQFLTRWLKLHEDEIAVFLWTALLLFLIRSSGMVLNNYAETAFLKRYGVEYLPIVNMLNSIATFVLTGILAVFMAKLPGPRLLALLFLFCGAAAAIIRLLIPQGLAIIYPLLFMLKSQFELLQALLFWNLANDLYNTRQSKRIFPLLTAAGVIGLIGGSFGTPYLAGLFRLDNLLFVYFSITLLGALVIQCMQMQLPVLIRTAKKGKKVTRRSPMSAEFRKVWPLIRQSTLVKIVLVLTFMPNVAIPIMNYQFNFAIDAYFASESGMLEFFGYFRGILNIISLVLLLFVGRLYSSFGLPVALMFHPFNYIIAFLAFLFRFDLLSAVYARMSTNILRTTINMPANSILIGLFPESYRNMVRPFLRGTVVRAALFLGSGLILVSAHYFHPRYLSLVALPFVLTWLAAPFILKRKYASILTNLVSRNLLDLKSLEEENLGRLFKKDRVGEELKQLFLSAKGEDALWYARLLSNLDVADLDRLVLEALPGQDTETRVRLLEMLSQEADRDTVEKLQDLLDPQNPRLTVAVLRTVRRIAVGVTEVPDPGLADYLENPHPEVRGHAAGCLYLRRPAETETIINRWLSAKDGETRRAGVIAAGETGRQAYAAELSRMLDNPDNTPLFPDILKALSSLEAPELSTISLPFLDHPRNEIRQAALEVVEVADETLLRRCINLLGDPDQSIARLAMEKIRNAPYVNGQTLIESLSRPNRRVRESVFELLESLNIRNLDLLRFTRQSLERAYTCLAAAAALDRLPDLPEKKLLREHFYQKKDLLLENTFRVLAIHDKDSRMRTVFRGLFSRNARQRANSIELLGDIMDRKLFRMFAPLVEGGDLSQSLSAGNKFFRLPDYDPPEENLLPALLSGTEWVETVLALGMLEKLPETRGKESGRIRALSQAEDIHIRRMAGGIARKSREHLDATEQIMDTELTISEKILLLKNIAIFSGLTVSELGAIARVTEEVAYPAGETVITEGEAGDTVFLIIKGEVAVCKSRGAAGEIKLDTMEDGDYFGEMALFEEAGRSATIRSQKPSRFLVLHKQEFNELVREYPGIALQICTVLSHRLRNLHEKLTRAEGIPDSGVTEQCK